MSNRAIGYLPGAVVLSLSVIGCGGSQAQATRPASASDSSLQSSAIAGDDASRCEYKGRPDREAKESAGLGSVRPNIRRVFAIVGDGDERRRVLLCREVDTNLDGVKDVMRTFNDKGESLRELADSDYDGKIDTWVTFARGHMAKVEVDTDHHGSADEWRYYVKGKLARVQRDTNHDGRPDVWEIYEDGELRRMGYDLDFDGHVDRWDRDEVAERTALERELQDEEKRKREQAAASGQDSADPGKSGSGDNTKAKPGDKPGDTASGSPGATGTTKDKAPVEGHVSPRKR